MSRQKTLPFLRDSAIIALNIPLQPLNLLTYTHIPFQQKIFPPKSLVPWDPLGVPRVPISGSPPQNLSSPLGLPISSNVLRSSKKLQGAVKPMFLPVYPHNFWLLATSRGLTKNLSQKKFSHNIIEQLYFSRDPQLLKAYSKALDGGNAPLDSAPQVMRVTTGVVTRLLTSIWNCRSFFCLENKRSGVPW